MKKILLLTIFLLLSICFINKIQAEESKKIIEAIPAKFTKGKFWVYENRGSRLNHYVPASWAGDYGDIKFDDAWKENVYSESTCIKINYSAKCKQKKAWAGIFWNRDMSSSGMIKYPGFDLKEAQKMIFYIRGEKGGEIITEIGLRSTQDSESINIRPRPLSTEWQKYEIELGGKNISDIDIGFYWLAAKEKNPDGCTFFIDDIVYEQNNKFSIH